MSVIAKKIARAAEQPVERSDAKALAESLMPDLSEMLTHWLGLDELDGVAVSGHWVRPSTLVTPDITMTRQGLSKARRAVVTMPESMALSAVGRLLRIPVSSDPATVAALRPFLAETVLSLEDTLDELSALEGLSDGRDGWTMVPKDAFAELFSEEDVLQVKLSFQDPDGKDTQLDLILTSELIEGDGATKGNAKPVKPTTPRPAPRLGPCHVDVKAVADRIRMSVADCARLEIGRVVALPGLRFDHLELTVEMGEGPVPLVDASLGADQGVKAVRLNRGLDPDFKAPPPRRPSQPEPSVASGHDTVHA